MKRAVFILPLLCVSACAPIMNGSEQGVMPHERHPISVQSTDATLEISTGASASSLSEAESVSIRAFGSSYLQRGHGPLKVTASGPAMADRVADLLYATGLSRAQILISSTAASGLNLSYQRFEASAPDCGLSRDNLAWTQRNAQNRNFGCTAQHNLAAMISDPNDLNEPRGMRPADADRRSAVLESYRQGDVTASERSDDERGTISEAVEE